jgi:tripartite ATP-independent transporter DctP family solute receptor
MNQLSKKIAAALAVSCLMPLGASAQTVLKFSHYADTAHPGHAAAMQFAKNVEARTQGRIKVDVFSGSQLGAPPEQLQQVKLGTIDIGVPTQGQLDKFDRAFAAVMMPFVFDDLAHAHRVLDGPAMAWFGPIAEKQGLVILSNWEWGFRNLTNAKRPVNSPDDVKGLKIRVPPEIQLEATMEALGAQVTKIAFPELYMSLSQGVVDGQENPVSVLVSNKIFEVQKHLALTRHSYNNWVNVMNAKKFASLSAADQQILREESKAAGNMMRKALADAEQSQLTELRAKGMLITQPDAKAFRARMDPAYQKIASYAGEENVKIFLKMVNDARTK